MKAQKGVGVHLKFFFNLGARCGWDVPHPGCSTIEKKTRYPLYGRLGEPQGWRKLAWKNRPTAIRSPDRPANYLY